MGSHKNHFQDPEEKGEAAATDLPDLWVTAVSSPHEKCARCWHHQEDVNKNAYYPQLCGRCVENVSEGEGEERIYA